ncbi:hypothetical protein B1750_gp155 [Noumeavirus]|uniref:Uncharacterized protein n=1 Tax=Marseillevirus sp. TaxID=2809551 RepID=A0AA96J3S8_9VIRU|nr:hypothetical protein B1750_gp155 [Noumeavirus]AQM73136.1 hypothetical protein NMV_155 [Noumeavirus]QZX43845.1 hypothetical protein MarQu_263 [Marseillevirus sp.]WNL50415.1 hypothetical protein MarDSR_376 [Marseillevirus sp.]
MSRLQEATQKFETAAKFTEEAINKQDVWDLEKIMDTEAELYRDAALELEVGDVVILKGGGDAIFLELKDDTFIGYSRSRGFFEEGVCYIHSVSNHFSEVSGIVNRLGFVQDRQ